MVTDLEEANKWNKHKESWRLANILTGPKPINKESSKEAQEKKIGRNGTKNF